MARGESGRIVLEIDPAEKEQLYTAVTKDGLTLKDWFLRKAAEYLRERNQRLLFTPTVLAEDPAQYRGGRTIDRSVQPGKGRSKKQAS